MIWEKVYVSNTTSNKILSDDTKVIGLTFLLPGLLVFEKMHPFELFLLFSYTIFRIKVWKS